MVQTGGRGRILTTQRFIITVSWRHFGVSTEPNRGTTPALRATPDTILATPTSPDPSHRKDWAGPTRIPVDAAHVARPELYHAYREMVVPAGPTWVEEHVRRLTAAGIQPHFQLTCMPDLETVESGREFLDDATHRWLLGLGGHSALRAARSRATAWLCSLSVVEKE